MGYDVEIDPIAYALQGFSVHAGIRYAFWRLDLGAFAAEPPDWFHGSKGITAYYSGFGLKWDYRFFANQSGPFVGAEGAAVRVTLRPSDGGTADNQQTYSAGVRTGWQIDLGYGFYVVPWVGIGAVFGGKDVDLSVTNGDGTVRWESKALSIFPTIHLGWRGDAQRPRSEGSR